jgi:hypothetical protein
MYFFLFSFALGVKKRSAAAMPLRLRCFLSRCMATLRDYSLAKIEKCLLLGCDSVGVKTVARQEPLPFPSTIRQIAVVRFPDKVSNAVIVFIKSGECNGTCRSVIRNVIKHVKAVRKKIDVKFLAIISGRDDYYTITLVEVH